MLETLVLREPWDVDRRLAELGLERKGLLNVVEVANSSGADATPFHPANAAGTFSYQYGTWALRQEFVGDVWQLDRPEGVEAIRNDSTKVKVVFANVDLACDDHLLPRPRSRKGAGAERVCGGNLFGSLPHFAPRTSDSWATYYLMVDERGAAELTRPIVSGGGFSACVERIYLSIGGDYGGAMLSLNEKDIEDTHDPQVTRK